MSGPRVPQEKSPPFEAVELVESVYDFDEKDEGRWLEKLARAFYELIPKPGLRGLHAALYRTSDEPRCSFERACTVESSHAIAALDDRLRRVAEQHPAEAVRFLRTESFAWLGDGDLAFSDGQDEKRLRADGIGDVLVVNGRHPKGLGCAVSLCFDYRIALSPALRDMLTWGAAHVVAALRVRRALDDRTARDERRYGITHRNTGPAAREWLTPREHQVVALAARGHANKSIAYELGITTSTVGVLLGRAASRLGVASRRALIEAVSASSELPD